MKVRLYIEVCSMCNLKCAYCFEKEYAHKMLLTNRIITIINSLQDVLEDVVITGGEPTLHPDFDKIIRYIASKVPVTITTNGTNYPPALFADLLQEYDNVYVQVSLDSIEKMTVANLCGEGTFEAVMDTLNYLKEYSKQLSIAVTLLNQSPTELLNICEFAKKRNIKCYFPTLLPFGGVIHNWEKLLPTVSDYILLEETLLNIIANDKQELICSNKVDTMLSNFFSFSDDEDYYILKVDADGHLLSCPATDYSYECSRIGSIEDIVNSDELHKRVGKNTTCCSAHMIDLECSKCLAEKYCKRVFCGNCIHLISKNKDTVSYLCKTYQYHYRNLQNAYNKLRGTCNE